MASPPPLLALGPTSERGGGASAYNRKVYRSRNAMILQAGLSRFGIRPTTSRLTPLHRQPCEALVVRAQRGRKRKHRDGIDRTCSYVFDSSLGAIGLGRARCPTCAFASFAAKPKTDDGASDDESGALMCMGCDLPSCGVAIRGEAFKRGRRQQSVCMAALTLASIASTASAAPKEEKKRGRKPAGAVAYEQQGAGEGGSGLFQQVDSGYLEELRRKAADEEAHRVANADAEDDPKRINFHRLEGQGSDSCSAHACMHARMCLHGCTGRAWRPPHQHANPRTQGAPERRQERHGGQG